MFNLTNPSFKTAALLALGMSAPASAMASTGNPTFNGYYGGLMGGLMQTHSKFSASTTATWATYYFAPIEQGISQEDVSLYNYSATGALFIGYGHFFPDSKAYLAGEVFGNWSRRNNSIHNSDFHSDENNEGFTSALYNSTSVKLRDVEYGFDLRPGYLLDTNTMLYGRIGVAFNQVKSTSNNTFAFTNYIGGVTPLGLYDSFANETRNHHKAALRLGFGIEHKLSDEVSITGDYIYTYYGKTHLPSVGDVNYVNGEDDGALFTLADGLVGDATTRMSTQTAMLGIKYTIPQLC